MSHKLEQSEVLQAVFDTVAQALKVKFDGTGIEVSIDASLDSIKIGDGVDTVTITTVGAKKALDVNVTDITLDHSNDSVRLGNGTNLFGSAQADHASFQLLSGKKSLKFRTSADGTYEYSGLAAFGSNTSEAKWKIIRETLSNGNIDAADGNENFDNVWDDRASLTYS